jgi:hypothetical protein
MLPRAPRTDDRLFDHRGCVLGDRETFLLRSKEDHSSRVPKYECRPNVLMIKRILEGQYRWLMALDELRDFVMEFGKPMG